MFFFHGINECQTTRLFVYVSTAAGPITWNAKESRKHVAYIINKFFLLPVGRSNVCLSVQACYYYYFVLTSILLEQHRTTTRRFFACMMRQQKQILANVNNSCDGMIQTPEWYRVCITYSEFPA